MVLVALAFTLSCNNSYDRYFEESYFNNVCIIEKYGKQCCQEMLIIDTDMANLEEFTGACDYLGALTGCDFHVTYVDIPVYNSKIDLMYDVAYLKKWYLFNGRKLNKDQADSIVSCTEKNDTYSKKKLK